MNQAVSAVQEYVVDTLQGESDDEDAGHPGRRYGADGMTVKDVAAVPQTLSAQAPPLEQSGAAGAVFLECVKATGIDPMQLPPQQRCIALTGPEGRWMVGRQTHPEVFVRLVPDEAMRMCISRTHFELAWAPMPSLFLRKLGVNELLVNGTPASTEGTPVMQGAHLGFCSPNSPTVPFLVFVVSSDQWHSATGQQQLPQQQLSPPGQAVQPPQWPQQPQQPQQPAWELPKTQFRPDQTAQGAQGLQLPPPARQEPAPTFDYYLVCSYSVACDINTLPISRRTLGFDPARPFLVGRQHQCEFFEMLLGKEQRYLTIVGRSHLEICPSDSQPGAFTITNGSSNPISVGEQRLSKGQQCLAQPPTSIMFLACSSPDANGAFSFLTLSFECSSMAKVQADQKRLWQQQVSQQQQQLQQGEALLAQQKQQVEQAAALLAQQQQEAASLVQQRQQQDALWQQQQQQRQEHEALWQQQQRQQEEAARQAQQQQVQQQQTAWQSQQPSMLQPQQPSMLQQQQQQQPLQACSSALSPSRITSGSSMAVAGYASPVQAHDPTHTQVLQEQPTPAQAATGRPTLPAPPPPVIHHQVSAASASWAGRNVEDTQVIEAGRSPRSAMSVHASQHVPGFGYESTQSSGYAQGPYPNQGYGAWEQPSTPRSLGNPAPVSPSMAGRGVIPGTGTGFVPQSSSKTYYEKAITD